jgi:hypothetical protein
MIVTAKSPPDSTMEEQSIMFLDDTHQTFLNIKSPQAEKKYPVIDMVICHGDFLNADHDYVHDNKSVKGFGSYGDIMIRDRKMYVAPTPFALTEGTTGLITLILPESKDVDNRFKCVGDLNRIEADEIIVGYNFDLRSNKISSKKIKNNNAGKEHKFKAYRLKEQSDKKVCLLKHGVQL